MSRKERRKLARQALREGKEKERHRTLRGKRLRQLAVYAASLIILGGVGYWAYGKWIAGMPGEFVPSLGNRHIPDSLVGSIVYNSEPPTSGPHLSYVARWGVHERPIPKELQVHNLEDGGVMVQYNCPDDDPACRDLVEKLAQIVRRHEHTVLAPYPGMSHKIALTAWTRIDKFDEFDERRITRFIEAYAGLDHHPRR